MNKNFLFFLLLLIWQPVVIQAQKDKTDSLKRALQNEKRDTGRVLLLTELSRAYLYSKPDTALLLAQQGLALARGLNFTKGEGISLTLTATVFSKAGNDPKALELYLEALKKFEHIHDWANSAWVLSRIGNFYAYQGDYRQGLAYTFKAKVISDSLHDASRMWVNALNLGDSYEKLDRLDSARFYTQQAYDLTLKVNDMEGTGFALINLGNVYAKMGKSTIALEFYRSVMSYLITYDNNEAICECTLGIARMFQRSGSVDSSLYYAKLSMAIAKDGGFTKYILDASDLLADYYKTHHIVDSAYFYLAATIVAKDSLFSEEKSRQLQKISFTETLRQQEIETQKKAAAEEQKNNLQYAAIAIGLIVFIGLFLLLSRSIIVNEKWIEFLGLLGLLIVFEFINLLIHPYLAAATHHSPVWMLLVLVAIAALLVPLHHKLEHWVTHQMTAKNKRLRLKAAKRMVAELESDPDIKE